MPSLLTDPAQLHATARRIRDHAGELRHRAALLSRSAEQVHWHSCAATEFRQRVTEVAHRMSTAAAQLDVSADHLDRHARRVGHALAGIEHTALKTAEVLLL